VKNKKAGRDCREIIVIGRRRAYSPRVVALIKVAFELRQGFASGGNIMKVLLSLFFLFTTQFQGPPVEIGVCPTYLTA